MIKLHDTIIANGERYRVDKDVIIPCIDERGNKRIVKLMDVERIDTRLFQSKMNYEGIIEAL